ncbi:MAG TPA: hypothetical protein VHA14_11800, partial [Bryobacteraceae bacterium]|nr:hypothetical protein [Bryobacteraceae bacterium]
RVDSQPILVTRAEGIADIGARAGGDQDGSDLPEDLHVILPWLKIGDPVEAAIVGSRLIDLSRVAQAVFKRLVQKGDFHAHHRRVVLIENFSGDDAKRSQLEPEIFLGALQVDGASSLPIWRHQTKTRFLRVRGVVCGGQGGEAEVSSGIGEGAAVDSLEFRALIRAVWGYIEMISVNRDEDSRKGLSRCGADRLSSEGKGAILREKSRRQQAQNGEAARDGHGIILSRKSRRNDLAFARFSLK